jgi:hypothetical protein
MQTVYLLRLMPVFVGLILFAGYFVIPNHKGSIIAHC